MPTVTRPTPADHGIERVAWHRLEAAFLREWGRPNGRFDPEHMTVYGKSGSGKTYFVAYILKRRAQVRGSHVVILMTKKTDKTISMTGFPVIEDWPPGYKQNQVIYWARAKGISAEHRVPQREKVKKLLNALWRKDSNVVLYIDELPYAERMLRLQPELETYYREGRANGITIVSSLQRPAGVTRFAHSEAGWTVAFPPKDVDDRDRVAEVLGDRARFRVVLDDLDRELHEFLIRHDLTGQCYISHLPKMRAEAPRARRGVSARRRGSVRSSGRDLSRTGRVA